MSKKPPSFVAERSPHEKPLLIIDRQGLIGNALVRTLGQEYLSVLVSANETANLGTTVHVPYGNRLPRIPDNDFSRMLVVYEGEKETLTILRSLAKKRDESGGKVYICLPLSLASPRLLEEIQKRDPRAVVVIFGEIFGRGVEEQNQTTAYLQQLHLYGKLLIPNTGLHFVYPILLDDLVLLLVSIIFTDDRQKKPLLLFPKHPPTALSVARLIVRRQPNTAIDFYKEPRLSEISYIPEGEYVHPVYDLAEALGRSGLLEKAGSISPPRKRVSVKRRRWQGRMLRRILLLICLLLLPFILVLLGAGSGGLLLRSSQSALERGQFSSSQQYASWAEGVLSLSARPAGLLAALGRGTALGPPALGLAKTISAEERLAAAAWQISEAAQRFRGIGRGLSLDPKTDFLAGVTAVKEALITLEEVQSEGSLPASVSRKLGRLSQLETIFANTQDVLPSLFGFQGAKNYLLLFQNNMELRPGGGFIGSYATFTMDKGRLLDFAIHNVYDADGKLTGHVEPPYPLRRYMQIKHWFLRDSNFDADFGKDGKMAAYFLSLETGSKADVVLSVDVSFLQDLLMVAGPVYVPEYKETVGASNFYSLAEKQAQQDFFPGSTQKQDFLRSVFSALKLRLTDTRNISYSGLLNVLLSGVKEKHLLIAATDDRVERLLSVSGLSSSLVDERQAGQNTVLDYIGVNEANLGANKANYYLKRRLQQEVAIADNGDETSVLTVTYDNTSTADTVYGGDYKNYLRFLLPGKAVVTDIAIDGVDQKITDAVTDPYIYESPRFVIPTGLEVQTTSEMGKKIVGFLIVVPKKTKKQIQITYTTPHPDLFVNSSFTYDLFVLKQPGTGSDPYSLTLRYPDDARVVSQSTKALTDLGGKLIYSGDLSGDKHFTVQFSGK